MNISETLDLFILAIIQGICEFLPVSSSGHMLVFNSLVSGTERNWTDSELLTIEIMLHLGTLFSICVFFHKEIWSLLRHPDRRWLYIVIGTVPAGLCGFIVHEYFPSMVNNMVVTTIGFVVTAFLIFHVLGMTNKKGLLCWLENHDAKYIDSEKVLPVETNQEEGTEEKTPALPAIEPMDSQRKTRISLWVGLAQALAVLPGFSRSGFTISAGLVCGMNAERATVFSFMLAIPIVLGSACLNAIHLWNGDTANLFSNHPGVGYSLFLAMGLSGITGIFTLALLMRLLKNGRMFYVGFWLLLIAVFLVYKIVI